MWVLSPKNEYVMMKGLYSHYIRQWEGAIYDYDFYEIDGLVDIFPPMTWHNIDFMTYDYDLFYQEFT